MVCVGGERLCCGVFVMVICDSVVCVCMCTNTVTIYVRDRKKIRLHSARGKSKEGYSKRSTMTSNAVASWMGQSWKQGQSKRIEAPQSRWESLLLKKTQLDLRLERRKNSSYIKYSKIRYWFLPISLTNIKKTDNSWFGQRCGRCILSYTSSGNVFRIFLEGHWQCTLQCKSHILFDPTILHWGDFSEEMKH